MGKPIKDYDYYAKRSIWWGTASIVLAVIAVACQIVSLVLR